MRCTLACIQVHETNTRLASKTSSVLQQLTSTVADATISVMDAVLQLMVVVTMQSCKDNGENAPCKHCTQLHQRQALPLAYDLWQNVDAGRIQKGACKADSLFSA